MSEIKASLFDCDGVIVQVRPIEQSFYGEWLNATLALTYSALEQLLYFNGRSALDSYETIKAHYERRGLMCLPTDFMAVAGGKYLETAQKHGIKLIDGVYEMFEGLHARGREMAVVSNSGPNTLSAKTAPVSGFFNGRVFSACDVAEPKPSPASILYAAQLMNRHPKQCSFSGDSIPDMLAAKAAKIGMIVGVTYDYPANAEEIEAHLRDAGADEIVHSPEEHKDLLLS